MMKSVILFGLSLLLGCMSGDVISSEMQGQPPVDRITVVDTATDGRRIGVYLEAEADWKFMVNLESFEGFHPAMSHEEARKSIGPPDEIRGSMYIYNRSNGRVVVALVVDRSGSDVFEQWQIRSHPTENDLLDVLGPGLSGQIEPLLQERSVVVLLHPVEYSPLLRVSINNKQVESMTWYHE